MHMKSAKAKNTPITIRFNGKIVTSNKVGASAVITLPKAASAKLPSRGIVNVEGTINAFPFRAPLLADGKGSHMLKVSPAMRHDLAADDIDTIAVEITRVEDEPEIRIPADLKKSLKAIPSAEKSWADITPMARRDWIFSISSSRQEETRRRRIDKACDMLKSGKRRLCCFPGIKWMMKKNARTCGMWLPLPGVKKRKSAKSSK